MRKKVGLAAAIVVLGSTMLIAAPAEARLNVRLCDAVGTLRIDRAGGLWRWRLQGDGTCRGTDLRGARPLSLVHLDGDGTSRTLGKCSGNIFVANVHIDVTVTETPVVGSGGPTTESQKWFFPVNLFSPANVLLIKNPGANGLLGTPLVGAALITHRFGMRCGNRGTQPSAGFDFVTLFS